jgi:hypothetical protein
MLRVAFALLFGWIALLPAQAQPMSEAAQQLAARISSLLQRRATVSLEVQNLTPWAPAESSSFRSSLEEELRKSGLEMAVTAQPELRLRVTVSENARGLLFVAEASAGETRQIAMMPWTMPSRAEAKPTMKLTQQPIWEQRDPILDLALVDSGSTMLVLGPNKVSSYRAVNGKWTPAGSAAMSLSRPMPRDPRGKMEIVANGLRVYLPGTTCTGVFSPDMKLACTSANESWDLNSRPVRWQADRNLLESDGVRGAFYTFAAGLTATADGRVLDRTGEPVSGAEGWGSDLATIDNACEPANPAVLASKAGDGRERDEVQAYELANGLTRPASEPLSLSGPMTALWQSTLVVRNSKTGNYEASRLGLACAE